MTDTFTPRGWICPVCGAGCAPTLDRCCPGWTVTPAPRPLTAADVQRYAPIPLSPGSTVSGEASLAPGPGPQTVTPSPRVVAGISDLVFRPAMNTAEGGAQ